MCGRYFIAEEDRSEELRQIIEAVQRGLNRDVPLKERGEIHPSDVVPVCDAQTAVAAKWGFTLPGSSRLIINARSETFRERPMFREAAPCLIPASGYFEWENVAYPEPEQMSLFEYDGKSKSVKSRKEKRAIHPKGKQTFYMAGLLRYEAGFELPVFTILTRPVASELAHIHDRMPMILSDEDAKDWLAKGKLPDVDGKEYGRYESRAAE
ncbi:MAG: SOS response-associated peptidase [Oscillospiraceae bacterium]|jgi:putative SOS response-associated peptidase YedK|nr:SOS response-associated peptidase [Oscillospiraceae bacterium]